MKTLYLCGFMGCGKTRTGKITARLLHRKFVDCDDYIVKEEGRTIPEIFEQSGEAYFRKAETEAIEKLSGDFVVATGGGALINENSARAARENGIVVFINTDFELCYERIKDDKNRPLVCKNTKEQLKELFEERKKIYKKNSHFSVNGNASDIQIAEEIKKLCLSITQK